MEYLLRKTLLLNYHNELHGKASMYLYDSQHDLQYVYFIIRKHYEASPSYRVYFKKVRKGNGV